MPAHSPDPIASSSSPRRRRSLARAALRARSVLFWIHLTVGVTTGLVVLVMAATGAVLAFQRQILEWSVGRHLEPPPPGAERLSLDTLLARARAAAPADENVSAVTIESAERAPVSFGLSARRSLHLDPYTGSVLPASTGLQTFFFELERWHRALATGRGLRGTPGVTITGACNLAFLFLIVSGMLLWIPRRWSWRAFRAVLLIDPRARGRQRDWNWHHVLGIWMAPVLFLLVLSGVFISYRWPMELLERAVGSAAPPPRVQPPAAAAEPPGPATAPSLDAIFARATTHVPAWRSVQLLLPREPTGRVGASITTATASRPDRRVTLSFAPTLAMREEPGYAAMTPARRLQAWVRDVHTGEAAGVAGQAVAALACLAAVLMVWTGIALAWRRFLRAVRPRRSSGATPSAA